MKFLIISPKQNFTRHLTTAFVMRLVLKVLRILLPIREIGIRVCLPL